MMMLYGGLYFWSANAICKNSLNISSLNWCLSFLHHAIHNRTHQMHPLILPLFPLWMLFPIHFCHFSCLFCSVAHNLHSNTIITCRWFAPAIARFYHVTTPSFFLKSIFVRENHLHSFCKKVCVLSQRLFAVNRIDLTGNPRCTT